MIGIFDSGVGGLTVVKEVMKQLPDYQLVYFGDTARMPYGNKSSELITQYAVQNVRFLITHGATIIIAGCNTASAIAKDAMVKAAGDVPVFDVITPAVQKAVSLTRSHRIGVIGTYATVNSGVYKTWLHEHNPDYQVFQHACPLLVPLVEENWMEKPETKMIIRRYLAPLKSHGVDSLILGCTHYPLLKSLIQKKIGRRTSIVDPAVETAQVVKTYLTEHPEVVKKLAKNANHKFFFSDLTPKVHDITHRWLDKKVKIEKGIAE